MDYPELVFIGYTIIDCNISPTGKKTILPGGGAYFASIAASKMLKPIGLVTRIGKDFDQGLLFPKVLKDGVKIIKSKKSGEATVVYNKADDPTDRDLILDLGISLDLVPEDIPKKWLKKIKYVHIATMPPEKQTPFIAFIRKNSPKAIISIDTDIAFLKDEKMKEIVANNFARCDIIFANRREFNELKDTILKSKDAIIKLDKDGAIYMKDGIEQFKYEAKRIEAVNSTGAGDVFAGTFLANLGKGITIKKSIELATETATYIVSKGFHNTL